MRKFLIPLCVGLVVLTACLSAAQTKALQDASEVVGSTAPLLPPPFGLIAGAVATALSAVASVGANKASNAAFKKKEKASMLIQLATDHSSSIMVAVIPVLAALRASGILHFSDTELALLTTTFAAPVATKKVMRKKAA